MLPIGENTIQKMKERKEYRKSQSFAIKLRASSVGCSWAYIFLAQGSLSYVWEKQYLENIMNTRF